VTKLVGDQRYVSCQRGSSSPLAGPSRAFQIPGRFPSARHSRSWPSVLERFGRRESGAHPRSIARRVTCNGVPIPRSNLRPAFLLPPGRFRTQGVLRALCWAARRSPAAIGLKRYAPMSVEGYDRTKKISEPLGPSRCTLTILVLGLVRRWRVAPDFAGGVDVGTRA